eukprot:scaffold83073_cov78-Phaeocystis_antarctica.AAC.1
MLQELVLVDEGRVCTSKKTRRHWYWPNGRAGAAPGCAASLARACAVSCSAYSARTSCSLRYTSCMVSGLPQEMARVGGAKRDSDGSGNSWRTTRLRDGCNSTPLSRAHGAIHACSS